MTVDITTAMGWRYLLTFAWDDVVAALDSVEEHVGAHVLTPTEGIQIGNIIGCAYWQAFKPPVQYPSWLGEKLK